MTLYKKELGRVTKSFIFLLMAVAMAAFLYSQGVLPPDSTLAKPEPGAADYGMKASDDPALIMPEAVASLNNQYAANRYTTYPNGYLKNVKLNQADRDKMGAILNELSLGDTQPGNKGEQGTSAGQDYSVQIGEDGLMANDAGQFEVSASYGEAPGAAPGAVTLNPSVTWERFSELMLQADKLLGGGSDFSTTYLSHRFGQIPVTYEEALADYGLCVEKDRLSGTHARLFSDYAGFLMGLLPVIPAVFLFMRDRKNIASMVYTRQVSSLGLVLSRYGALMTAVMLPILAIGAVLTAFHAVEYGIGNIDLLAYFKYALGWLLPTAMASCAVGMFFTILTGSPVAIAIQLVWWFVDTMGGNGSYIYVGFSPLQLMPRHNSLGETQAFLDYLPQLIQNRIFITLIAAVLVAASVLVLHVKRKGWPDVTFIKHSKV